MQQQQQSAAGDTSPKELNRKHALIAGILHIVVACFHVALQLAIVLLDKLSLYRFCWLNWMAFVAGGMGIAVGIKARNGAPGLIRSFQIWSALAGTLLFLWLLIPAIVSQVYMRIWWWVWTQYPELTYTVYLLTIFMIIIAICQLAVSIWSMIICHGHTSGKCGGNVEDGNKTCG